MIKSFHFEVDDIYFRCMMPWITDEVFDIVENSCMVIQNINNCYAVDDNLIEVVVTTVWVLNLLNDDGSELVATKLIRSVVTIVFVSIDS